MSEFNSTFIRFKPQPDFPVHDINTDNAAMASYYFTSRPEAESYTATHLESLPMLHAVGNSASLAPT